MTTVLIVALAALALASTARLAQEHHALHAAWTVATTAYAWTARRYRRRFIGLGTRVAGRDTPRADPIRHAREAAAA